MIDGHKCGTLNRSQDLFFSLGSSNWYCKCV